jgi:hypothetical protein
MTPARTRPGEFLEQAIRDTARGGGTPPSDSSSSLASSYHESDLDSSDEAAKRRKKSVKNKRKMTHRMLPKPIPPIKYDGSADATLFYCWCRESTSFVRVGRVPASDQLFFLSYYLTGKVLDFYEQVVIRKPATYTLEDFSLDLFDFCFSANFRNKMRDQLNRCYQNAKPVLEHINVFEKLWRVVGLPNDQEKVVRFWRSLRVDIQQELYRMDLNTDLSGTRSSLPLNALKSG